MAYTETSFSLQVLTAKPEPVSSSAAASLRWHSAVERCE